MEPALLGGGIGFCLCELFWDARTINAILISILLSLFTAGTLTGFDASGHIAEETKSAQ